MIYMQNLRTLSIITVTTLGMIPNIIQAAAPLTHLVLAEKFLEKLASSNEIEEQPFIVGNMFPDIRCLGEISREETHEVGVTVEEVVRSPSSFVAGVRLHSLVDEVRENLVVKWKIYDCIEQFEEKHKATLLKLIEDEILYDQTNPEYFAHFLDIILEEEMSMGIPLKTHQTWHLYLQRYLSQKPSELLSALSETHRGFLDIPPSTIQMWSNLLPKLSEQEYLQNYVDDLLSHFSEIFQKSHSKIEIYWNISEK